MESVAVGNNGLCVEFMKFGTKTRKDFMLFSFFPFIDSLEKEFDFMKLAKDKKGMVLCDRDYFPDGSVVIKIYGEEENILLVRKIANKFLGKFKCRIQSYSGFNWAKTKSLKGVQLFILGPKE
tara:strand:- start:259 stop:627 length:369 start_codon:yes stop_codon:yes gene_type:complete